MGALSGCSSDDDDDSPPTPTPDPTPTPTPAPDLTQQLRANVKTVVVIFAENRSFNDLLRAERPRRHAAVRPAARGERHGAHVATGQPHHVPGGSSRALHEQSAQRAVRAAGTAG
ncbi:hypothetical protein G6F68_015369 [Rhizopus microsporus]|nr:hypothetical protein G6F68_015369 [Rhizopus microsporus]